MRSARQLLRSCCVWGALKPWRDGAREGRSQRWLLHSVQHKIVHSAPANPRTPAEMHLTCDPSCSPPPVTASSTCSTAAAQKLVSDSQKKYEKTKVNACRS